ncbi:MAG: hypothetical protein RR840_04285 [Clostridium sp.]
MNFTVLLVIIGVVGYLYEAFNKAAKEGDKKARKYREENSHNVVGEEFEYMDSPPIHIETENKPKKKKKKKDKKNLDPVYSSKVDNKFTPENIKVLNYTIGQDVEKDDKPKVQRTKRSPFNYTKNPLTNAVIASEILSKPKCRR